MLFYFNIIKIFHMSTEKNVKRVVYVNTATNAPRPGSFVKLNKTNVLKTALLAKNSGRLVEISENLLTSTNLIVQNDAEIAYGFTSTIIGVIKSIGNANNSKVVQMKVEVPSISIDNKPMLIFMYYNDAIVVEIRSAEKRFQEIDALLESTIKYINNDNVVKIANIKDNKILVAALLEENFSNNDIEDIVKCGISDLTLLQDENDEILDTYAHNDNELMYSHVEEHLKNQPSTTFTTTSTTSTKEKSNDNKQHFIEFLRTLLDDENADVQVIDFNNMFKKKLQPEQPEPLAKTAKIKQCFDENNHVMIDMETLSTEFNAAIVEISLVQFNPRSAEIINQLKVKFDIDEVLKAGYDVSKSTLIDFWLNQPEEVRQQVLVNNDNRKPLFEGWLEVYNFLKNIKDVQIWGKGPTFDISKMSYAMKQEIDESLPWKYWNERCVRTILAIDPQLGKSVKFVGSKHESTADCYHQIKQISKVINEHL